MSDFSVVELVNDDSFRAWAEGQADAGEKTYWDRWVRQSAKNRRLARQAQAKIIGFSFRSQVRPHTEIAWKKLRQRIGGQIRFRQLSVPRRRRPLWIYGAAASILVIIAVGLSELIYTPAEKVPASAGQQKVQTAYGQREKITFPGGASIVLNAHSTLTYTANQSKRQGINVTLQGEAYFSTAGRTRPGNTAFTVRTPDGKITDIGTQFVVSTREGHTRVILKRGEVAIDRSAGNGDKHMLLDPGQMATFNKKFRYIRVKRVNPDVYTSWTTNKLIFDHTPLTVIKNRLEHTYGMHVVTCGLHGRLLSGSVKNAGLPIIVSALAEALHTTSAIKDDTVYIGCNCQ